jgi:hypothetical protein
VKQISDFPLPEFGKEGRRVTGGLVASWDHQDLPLRNAFDLTVQNSEFRWIALVIRRVDGEHKGLDAL